MNATSMLGTTDNIQASITPELQEILALMNNGTSTKLLALLQDGLTAKIDRQELVNRARDMLQDMQKLEYVPATANADPTMKAYNRVINESLMVSDAFINSTDDIVAAKIEGAAAKVEQGDDSVEGILVNIFGGIMRCDVVAEGIISAANEVNISVPLVVRLEGTNVELGKKIIQESDLSIISASDLDDAAKKITEAI